MGNLLITLLTAGNLPDVATGASLPESAATVPGEKTGKSVFETFLARADRVSPLHFALPKQAPIAAKPGKEFADLAARIASQLKKKGEEGAATLVLPGMLPNAATTRFAALAAVVPVASPVDGQTPPATEPLDEALLGAPAIQAAPSLPMAAFDPSEPASASAATAETSALPAGAAAADEQAPVAVNAQPATDIAAAILPLQAGTAENQSLQAPATSAAVNGEGSVAKAKKSDAQATAPASAAATPVAIAPLEAATSAASAPSPLATPIVPAAPAADSAPSRALPRQTAAEPIVQASMADETGDRSDAVRPRSFRPATPAMEKLAAAESRPAVTAPVVRDETLSDASPQVVAQPVAAPKQDAPITGLQLVHARILPGQSTGEAVGVQIRTAIAGGLDKIRVQLHPEDLGRLEISINVGEGKHAQVVIAVERPETLAMLTRDHAALAQALADAGLKTDSGSLQFELRGQNGQAQNGDQQRRGQGAYKDEKDGSAKHERETETNDNGMYRLVGSTGINIRV